MAAPQRIAKMRMSCINENWLRLPDHYHWFTRHHSTAAKNAGTIIKTDVISIKADLVSLDILVFKTGEVFPSHYKYHRSGRVASFLLFSSENYKKIRMT